MTDTVDTKMTDSADATPEQWSTQQYEDALAHLERLSHQVDNLRSTLPSLVAPLQRPGASKAEIFAHMRKTAIQSTSDLKAFREDWISERAQELLVRSKESREKDGDLSNTGATPYDLKTFREDWTFERTPGLLVRNKESRAKHGDVSKSEDVAN
ncbi:hypothetical protein LTR62_004117 [Meristemomyces frigidus]|uniref:Uncharacterized protein n=1 Tax=Meristemomyces frigidus TaxID=1508187 RepID=A0AAN7YJL9_9PEZI|nr:hypothetical protein LTR62_004117 [Meristemomyces frigidus]